MSLNILSVALELMLKDTRPITVVLDDGTSFTGYYSGECYRGRSEDYAIDFELQSREYRSLTDEEYESPRGLQMAQSNEHVFNFRLEDVKTITFHLKP